VGKSNWQNTDGKPGKPHWNWALGGLEKALKGWDSLRSTFG
jgi:hypothetical protein